MQTHKAQQKSGKPPKNSSAKVIQPHIHGSGFYRGSLHRRDKYEYQADDAARRIMRGEEGVARILTSTPAASFRISASTGQPLSHDVRQDLEKGFGADLSALRIHHDSFSDSAAKNEEAKAFTSGRTIYFKTGAFNPINEAGRKLLAHEVAHVLQQTGRPSHDGRIRVTDIKGSGEIQTAKLKHKKYIDDNQIDFKKIKTEHNVSDDTALNDYADDIEKILKPAGKTKVDLLDKDAAKALSQFVGKNGIPKNDEQRAFLYDCLKLTGNQNRAVQLLSNYPSTKTHFWMESMGNVIILLIVANYKFFISIINREKHDNKRRLRSLWNLLMDTFRQMVFAPYRGVQTVNVTGIGTIEGVYNKLIEEGEEGTQPAENEIFWAAAGIMLLIDKQRLKLMRDFFKDFRRYDAPSISRTYHIARRVKKWAEELAKHPGETYRNMGIQVLAMANAAVSLWQKLFQFEGRFTFKSLAEAEKGYYTLPSHKHFTDEMPKKILAAAKTLFKINKDKTLPKRTTYTWQRNHARALIKSFSHDVLQMQLLKKQPDENLALAYAWAMSWIEKFVKRLSTYDSSKDKSFEKNHARNDVRFAHRLGMAIFLKNEIANIMAMGLKGKKKIKANKTYWQLLKDYIDPIEAHRDQGPSQIALLSDWEVDTTAKIGNMVEDFPEGIDELQPLTISQVVDLYNSLYHMKVKEKIDALLTAAKKDDLSDPIKSIAKDPILKESLESIHQPKRWVIKDHAGRLTPKDKTWKRTATDKFDPAMKLIKTHPKTKKFKTEEGKRKPSHFVIFPHLYKTTRKDRQTKKIKRRKHPVFAWSLPPLEAVIQLLRDSKQKDQLNQYVAGVSNLTKDKVLQLSGLKWLKYLTSDAFVIVGGKYLNKTELLKHAVSGTFKSKKQELRNTLRTLSTYERRILAKRVIAVLKKFDRHKIETFTIPNKVLRAIEDYGLFVTPGDDRYYQMAALIIAIAPSLNAGIGAGKGSFMLFFTVKHEAVDRYDVINGYLGHLIAAKAYTKGKRRARLLTLLNAKEKQQLTGQEKALDALLSSMKKQRRKQQTRLGITGKKSSQSIKSKNFATEVKASKEPFLVDGVAYRVLKIYKNFEFVPQYGTGDSRAPSILKVDGKPSDQRGNTKLLRIKIREGQPFDIREKDDDLLHQMHHVISTRAFVLGLENTAQIIEAYMNLLMDVVELIPGYGQAVMAARIAASVLQFLTSSEFDAIKGLLSGDVSELIDNIKKELTEMLSVEGAVELLFFGNATLNRISELGGSSKREYRITSRTKKSKLGKVFKVVMGLGRELAHALEILENRVQKPVRSMQSYVVGRPNLMQVLQLLARYAHMVNNIPSDPATIKQQVLGTAADFNRQLNEILITVQTLKIPREIVPVNEVAAMVVYLVLGRMGAKVRLSRRALWPILRATGTLDYLFGEIADAIKGTAGDPNFHWQKFVDTEIDEALRKSVQNIADGVLGTLNKVSGGAFGTIPTIKKGNAASEPGFSHPELQMPKFELTFPPDRGPDQSTQDEQEFQPLPASTYPLPALIRQDAEQRFGHDFSHVRVLAGGGSTRFTERYGTKGMTSGSYILLRSSSDLVINSSSRVLDHELVHVLQQTGARPSGGRYNNTPRFANQTGGVTINANREREADQIANQVKGRNEPTPVEIEYTSKPVWQPFPAELLRRLLRKFSSFAELEEIAALVAAEKITDLPTKSPRFKYADAIWQGVLFKSATLASQSSAFPRHLKKPAADVMAYFKSKTSKLITETMLRKLAAAASVDKIKKGPGKKKQVITTFSATRFARFLEAILLVKSGIGLSIDVKNSFKRKMSKSTVVTVADKEKIIDELKVNGIYLPAMGGTAALWTDAMKPFGADKATYQHRAREILRPFGAVAKIPGTDVNNKPTMVTVFKTTTAKLTFDDEFVKYVKRLQAGTTVKPEDLPAKKTYTNFNAPAGTVALRIGTYKEHSGPQKDRQSHHTTQYLLIEYFRNDSTPQPFKKGRKYPGLKWTQGKPEYLRSKKVDDINFEKLSRGKRGDAMPAILLARRTHQKGSLHIKPTKLSDDVKNGARASQGRALRNQFRNKFETELQAQGLKQNYMAHEKKNNADFNQYIDKTLSQSERESVAGALYVGMRGAYRYMYSIMMPALDRALVQQEVPYYREIAMQKKEYRKDSTTLIKSYDLQAKDMDAVYKEAVSNNKKFMEKQGWKT